jgi:hypothetical protein
MGGEAFDPSLRPLADVGTTGITIKSKRSTMVRCEVPGCGTLISTVLKRKRCIQCKRRATQPEEREGCER